MIFDIVFCLLFIFFVAFSWLRYYKYGILISVLGGVLAATILYKLTSLLLRGKRERKKLKLSEKKQAQRLAHYLTFSQPEEINKIFETALNQSGAQFSSESGGFLIIDGNAKTFMTFHFSAAPVSADFVCHAVKQAMALDATLVRIICCKSDKNASEAAISAPVKVKLFDIDDCFAFLKKNGALPDLPQSGKSRLVTLSNFGMLFFHRSRAKYYFISSVMLILFSYISIFRLYNLITGSILFVMFLYARFNKKFNPPQEQEI